MKEVLTRALSGIVYIALLLLSIFAGKHYYAFLIVIFGGVILFEFARLVNIKQKWVYLFYAVMAICVGYSTLSTSFIFAYLSIVLLVNLGLIDGLFKHSSVIPSKNASFFYILFYVIGGVFFSVYLSLVNGAYSGAIVATVFALIWVNDTFAFLVGKRFGKTKLLERISPKKTVEGFLGGVVFSILAGLIIHFYFNVLTIAAVVLLAVLTSVFGTLGDLVQSKFKRLAGVKDSGTIMPGHGGMYDRLDSLLFAAPFLYTLLIIIHYVS